MNILVTGGLGYIGSHTVVQLLENNHTVIIADNLSNSTINKLDAIKEIAQKSIIFYEVNVADESSVEVIFLNHQLDAIIHFAGYKSVNDSVNEPLKYYENNIMSTISITKLCLKYGVNKFIFSSSASVYGNNISPVTESMELLPSQSPYGETKIMCEKILSDIVTVNPNFSVSILRYFNPLGYHESGLLKDKINKDNDNLMSHIIQVAQGKKEKLYVYGNDYKTIDGTGIRDYIHIKDLVNGHILALNRIRTGLNIYNLGTGEGYTVLELIEQFKKTNNIDIPYEFIERRDGDIEISFANCTQAKKELGFYTKYTIEDMCRDSFI